ncbi:MAG: AAA family ATPase [Odoribacter splanchnicus]
MEKIIITIGRQFGSGGREIGKKLAEKFGISYYDKELLQLAAKESGFAGTIQAVEKHPEVFASLGMGFSMNEQFAAKRLFYRCLFSGTVVCHPEIRYRKILRYRRPMCRLYFAG